MARSDSMFVGCAGEHYVAFRLSQMGLVVGMPRAGIPSVDLLVSNRTGTRAMTIQVKTTEWAARTRGRGEKKAPSHLEFPLGHKAAMLNDPNVWFAFVDLGGRAPSSVPDVYLVPSAEVHKQCSSWAPGAKLVRWHPPLSVANPYKNGWERVLAQLYGA